MPAQPVVVVDTDDHVCTVRLNRPDQLNSLNLAAQTELLSALRTAARDADVRAVVLTGAGRAFCAGQDLQEARNAPDGGAMATAVRERYSPLVKELLAMPKPVIAAVNGVAAGGGMALALACDLRIACASATFTTAFAHIALSCDTGISWTLPRIVGRGIALDLLLRPRVVGGGEAFDLGLVHQTVADDEFEALVRRTAVALAQGPTLALASIKKAVNVGSLSTIDVALENEADLIAFTGDSQDHRRSLQAFLAKQKPRFIGR
jgi:2-(1,2-epoxy-1,2-dihydrophenyl)acetyl-CoA isomerase